MCANWMKEMLDARVKVHDHKINDDGSVRHQSPSKPNTKVHHRTYTMIVSAELSKNCASYVRNSETLARATYSGFERIHKLCENEINSEQQTKHVMIL